jgi:dTDP-4-amino-4,6-dideoxygalactose transaminase
VPVKKVARKPESLEIPNKIRVPLFVPDLGDSERAAVLDCLNSDWVAMGPRCEQLEHYFENRLSVKHAVSLNSCTAALHLSMLLVGVSAGDEVIVPSLTFAATANAVAFCGAKPVFADVSGLNDWTISPSDIERRITPNTKAVVVMHYGGFPCDMSAVMKVAEKHQLPVIEDACHGLGGSLNNRSMGTIGAIGCFSFYSNKIITTGEGGLLVTDNSAFAERAKRLRSHGMTANAIDRIRGAQGYDITEIGYNYRLDDIRAAIGLAQVKRLDISLAARIHLVERYRANLATVSGVTIPHHGNRGEPAHYIFPILFDDGLPRDLIREEMHARGVQTSIHYKPVHLFTHYAQSCEPLPLTESIASRAISLPLYPSMGVESVDLVCSVLADSIAASHS